MAAEETPEIWKSVFKDASQEAITSFASSYPELGIVVDTVTAASDIQGALVDTVDVGNTIIQAKQTYVDAGILIDQAEKEVDLIKKGKLEKEAREKLREFRNLRVDAGMSLYELGTDIVGISKDLKELKENYQKFAESMKSF